MASRANATETLQSERSSGHVTMEQNADESDSPAPTCHMERRGNKRILLQKLRRRRPTAESAMSAAKQAASRPAPVRRDVNAVSYLVDERMRKMRRSVLGIDGSAVNRL
ncbi:hypothetical protein BZM27_35580 [Paraburkholderia steynii]|uniref:Uncharacterized protein n=1 Tax=Paraburkholderia steynii TaxID=1245441 RepID=A0A4R0XE63_9BURK|nr:hypothetical protein BZM27_35580 [Paraburkholderia steynii]